MPNDFEESAIAPWPAPSEELIPNQVGKPEPDFLGRFHTLSIPPQVIARISTVPDLPVMTVGWAWNVPGLSIVAVNHRAHVLYDEHGRNDQSRVLEFTNTSLSSALNFSPDVMGGVLVCRCSVNWRRDSDGATGTTDQGEQRFGILGDNPTKAAIRTLLAELVLHVIAYKESRFRQFDNTSLPLWGYPNGFGVMQLDTPRPTARQLWHWRDNIEGGKTLHRKKQTEVAQHFENIYTIYPQAPRLTVDDLRLSLYQYYNGGWYWGWNPSTNTWAKSGDTIYGDDCLRIEKLVKAGTPPIGWD